MLVFSIAPRGRVAVRPRAGALPEKKPQRSLFYSP